MITRYGTKSYNFNIVEKDFDRETDHYLISGKTKDAKSSHYTVWHETKEAAIQYLKARAQKKIEKAVAAWDEASNELDELNKLYP